MTLFNRGKTNPELFPSLNSIIGDREKDLEKLTGKKWDVVIDTCGYSPANLAEASKILNACVGHYIFISSCSVYEHHPKEKVINEEAQILNLNLDFENLEPMGKDYGACKYLSERAIDSNFSGKITHIRPGLIVGPYDTTARFPYWIKRLADGGPTLAPSGPDSMTQFIDVRDLADWCVHIIENGIDGIFNAMGIQTTLGKFLIEANRLLGNHAELKWVPESFLRSHNVRCWTELPLWVFEEIDIFVSWDSSKSIQQGLRFRSVEETVLDTWEWVKGVNLDSLKYSPMKREKESLLLSEFCMEQLKFLPINFALHSDLCIKFRSDAFVASFGTDKPFWEDDGLGDVRYLDWLKSRDSDRYGAFHIWEYEKIIGQLELGEKKAGDDAGYVHLYYLIPEWRGKGISEALDKFAMNFLKSLGFKKVRLSVSPTNLRAFGFYKKNGWKDLGEQNGEELRKTLRFSLHYMEKHI